MVRPGHVGKSTPSMCPEWSDGSVSMSLATTRRPMLWMPINAQQTWTPPMSILKHDCNCSATMVSPRACQTNTAHRCRKTFILSYIKLPEWVPLRVRNGARPDPLRCPKPRCLRRPVLPKTGADIIWRRFNTPNLSLNHQTPTIGHANQSGRRLPQGRLAHDRSR